VFVTHDVDEAIRLADRIALMKDGRLHQYDTPERILDNPADKFVHDFMGADRALKRLVRVRVDSVMNASAPRVHEVAGPKGMADEASCSKQRFAYVVGGDGVMLGWYDCFLPADAPTDPVTLVDWRESTVRPDTSLKEALSRMLELGFRSIAVTDDAGRLVGDVALTDIESALGDGNGRATSAGDPTP